MSNPIMAFFGWRHLPEHLQTVSRPIGELAIALDDSIPDSAEKTAGLRKLLEAKDCFVRAAIPVPPAKVEVCPTCSQANGHHPDCAEAAARVDPDAIPY